MSNSERDKLVQQILGLFTQTISPSNLKAQIAGLAPKNKLAPAVSNIISNSKPEIGTKVVNAVDPDVLATAIIMVITKSINDKKSVKNAVPNQVRNAVAASIKNSKSPDANTVRLILKLIQNSLTPNKMITKPTAEEVVKVAGAPSSNAILKIILGALTKDEINAKVSQAPKDLSNNTANLIFKIIMNLFKPNGKMEGPEPMLNFFPAPTFRLSNKPKNGRAWYFGTKNEKTGWHLNTGGEGARPTGPMGPVGRPNFSKLNLSSLLRWRQDNPGDAANVNSAISRLVKNTLNKIRYSYSSSERLARLVELLKKLPINFSGRREIVTAIIAMIREVTNVNRFSNFNRNLRGVNNRNIRNALSVQRRRLERRRREERRPAESYDNYERRLRREGRRPSESYEDYERRMRRPVGPSSRYAPYNRVNQETNAIRRAIVRAEPPIPRNNSGGYRPNVGTGGAPPPLPPSQTNAINAAGGPMNAVQTVALVPGGAPEVAKAAEALNETGGNVRLAINVKGVSPAAVNAVQKLGGVSQTVKILEGLNTMAQTPETRIRKAAARPRVRRTKKTARGIRLTELNRVISAVKKQKLISLMAHNVTRTNNIHPNDEKLKKHYKKVMKSYILKTKFANIAKKAAKKRVQ